MKTYISIITKAMVLFGLIAASSCQKEQIPTPEGDQAKENAKNTKAKLPGDVSGTLKSAKIYFNSTTKTYTTGYAGGLDYSTMFTHPTNKFDYPDYSPWSPVTGPVTGRSSFMDYHADGNKFVVVLGTVPGGLIYKYDAKKYIDSLSKGYMPSVNGFITRSGGGAGGSGGSEDFYIVLSGQYVIDHSAPTGVAIVDINTKLPDSKPKPPPFESVQ